MKKIHGYFDSIYKDKKQQEFAVYGFFTTIPGKLSALLPGTDLIVFDFRITEIGGPVFKPMPRHRAGYIRDINGEWQVGNVINQQFQPQTSDFLQWLTDLVVRKYLSLKSDEQLPFAGDI